MVVVLAKAGAIKAWRKCMGPTNSNVARQTKPHTLRARFGTDGTKNACHGSDAVQSAEREVHFHFPQLPREELPPPQHVRDYLQAKPPPRENVSGTAKKTLNQVLIEGLTALCKEKPAGVEAVRWLAHWLLAHNPNKPLVNEPLEEKTSISVVQQLKAMNGGRDVMVVFVLGGPGCGKGTQCARIVQEYGFVHISAGDLLRAAKDGGSPHSQLISEYLREGKIVPLSITLDLVEQAMLNSGATHFLIDGFPRALEQGFAFEKKICPCTFILNFDCSEETMLERIMKRSQTSGRSDDNIESAKKRFVTFREQTMPVINHYSTFNKVRTVDASGSVEQVYAQVKRIFSQYLS